MPNEVREAIERARSKAHNFKGFYVAAFLNALANEDAVVEMMDAARKDVEHLDPKPGGAGYSMRVALQALAEACK